MKKRSKEAQEEEEVPAKRARRGKEHAQPPVATRKTRSASGKKAAQAPGKKATGKPAQGGTTRGKRAVTLPAAAGATTLKINRAPVLTLWVAVVAERQGYSWEEGLTFGRYISGLLAHSKGKSLGMYEDREKTEEEIQARKRRDREMGVQQVDVFGMKAPAVREGGTGGELRAVSQGKPIEPGGVESYLERSFGEGLEPAKAAMTALAAAIPPDEIGAACYKLYERLRPPWQGWGQKGELDLGAIRGLAADWRQEV